MVLLVNTLGDDHKKDQIITQDNKLVISKYNLNTLQLKLFLYTLTQIDSVKDKEFRSYKVDLEDFMDKSEYDKTRNNIHYLKKITKDLLSKVIEIREDDGTILQTHFISDIRIYTKQRQVEVWISPNLKPYLLQLKNRFTTYNIENILSFKSSLTIRYYQLLKRYYPGIKTFEMDIDRLKKILDVDKQYTRYFDFKKRCLLPQENELKDNSDLYFTFKEIRKGKSVIGLIFNIKSKTKISLLDNKVIDHSKEYKVQEEYNSQSERSKISKTDWFKTLRTWKIQPGTIQSLYKKYGEELITNNIKSLENDPKPKQSKSGWFIKSLENNWYEDDILNEKLIKEQRQRRKDLEKRKKDEVRLIDSLMNEYNQEKDKQLKRYEFLYEDKDQVNGFLEDIKDNPFHSQIKTNLLKGNLTHFGFMIYKQWIIEHYLDQYIHSFENYSSSLGVYVVKVEGEYKITEEPIELTQNLFDNE